MHQMDNPPTILNASHICFQSLPGSPQDATHPPASRPPRPAPHLRVQEEAEAKAVKGKEAGGEETGKETCATRQAWEETIWRWRWKTKASRHQLCKVSLSFTTLKGKWKAEFHQLNGFYTGFKAWWLGRQHHRCSWLEPTALFPSTGDSGTSPITLVWNQY